MREIKLTARGVLRYYTGTSTSTGTINLHELYSVKLTLYSPVASSNGTCTCTRTSEGQSVSFTVVLQCMACKYLLQVPVARQVKSNNEGFAQLKYNLL